MNQSHTRSLGIVTRHHLLAAAVLTMATPTRRAGESEEGLTTLAQISDHYILPSSSIYVNNAHKKTSFTDINVPRTGLQNAGNGFEIIGSILDVVGASGKKAKRFREDPRVKKVSRVHKGLALDAGGGSGITRAPRAKKLTAKQGGAHGMVLHKASGGTAQAITANFSAREQGSVCPVS